MYATAAHIERLKPPGRRAFLPWLFMLSGDVQALFKGKTPLPWLGGAGAAAFVALYVTTIYTSLDERRRHTRAPLLALAGLAAVTYALGIGYAGDWLLCFPLLSLASGIVLRGGKRPLGPVILALSGSAGIIAGFRGGASDSLTVSYGTILSGLVTAAILSLFETVAQLRATRQELARTAVEKERLRFSRDLHDLLGHTMSVVVVKAEAVRLPPRRTWRPRWSRPRTSRRSGGRRSPRSARPSPAIARAAWPPSWTGPARRWTPPVSRPPSAAPDRRWPRRPRRCWGGWSARASPMWCGTAGRPGARSRSAAAWTGYGWRSRTTGAA